MVKADFATNAGTITSTSSISLASISTGDYIFMTPSGGSSSITSFGTVSEGLTKHIEALGTLILRNDSAKLQLPGNADLTISTGDVISVRGLSGTAWKVVHMPYSGVPNAVINATSVTASTATSLLIISGDTIQKASAQAVSDLAGSGGYLALTAAHTISVANREYILDFTTAGVTCAIVPLASLSDGFSVTVMNTATTGDVTLDPDGAETLDGLSTRLLRPGDRATIVKATTGFKTVRGRYSFESSEASVSAGGVITSAHGLGTFPTHYGAFIRCKTNDIGYSASDEVDLRVVYHTGGNMILAANATNIFYEYPTGSDSFGNRATGAAANPTLSSWRIVGWAKIII